MAHKFFALLSLFLSSSVVFAAPILRREVPQEHSHEKILISVQQNLLLDNPDNIQDSVFALLGNGAAAAGAGDITDLDCLQQATADRAFTNAKARGDVDGQVDALIYRALERNTLGVGVASPACTSLQAVNPEIAAISQHQDPASPNAAAINKAIALELARQIAAVGGDPLLAIESGTFAPGDLNDATGRGNSCDDLGDPVGCIFTKNLLVPDVTEDEILAAVGQANVPEQQDENDGQGNDDGEVDGDTGNTGAPCPTVTVTVTGNAPDPTVAPTGTSTSTPNAPVNTPVSTGNNLQQFTGQLGGVAAPAVTQGGRGFVAEGSNDDFLNVAAALGRSCDRQHNGCANLANSDAGRASGLTVSQCGQQLTECRALI